MLECAHEGLSARVHLFFKQERNILTFVLSAGGKIHLLCCERFSCACVHVCVLIIVLKIGNIILTICNSSINLYFLWPNNLALIFIPLKLVLLYLNSDIAHSTLYLE